MSPDPSASNSPSLAVLQRHFTTYSDMTFFATGGMGTVYKAVHTSLDRLVAIKLLTHPSAADTGFRKSFEQEAHIMTELNHAHLASIYDYGEVEGYLYIVMQFIDGRTLHQAAHRKPVIPHESSLLVSKISRALSAAHDLGIIHGDIKPANIIIDPALNPVVVDFGLAHHLDDSSVEDKGVFGTPGYIAPELLAPPYQANPRTDIFSLGVILHELLTGKMPQEPYLPPSYFVEVDPRYDLIVMKALHPSPRHRYPNATSFASDLEKVLSGKALSESSLLETPADLHFSQYRS